MRGELQTFRLVLSFTSKSGLVGHWAWLVFNFYTDTGNWAMERLGRWALRIGY